MSTRNAGPRAKASKRLRAVSTISALLVSASCGDSDTAALEWSLEVPISLMDRVASIEGTILQGGCQGTAEVFRDRFSPAVSGMTPPLLEAGTYGFRGRAFDEACQVIASGCIDASLPTGEVTTAMAAMNGGVEPNCEPTTNLVPSNVPADLLVDSGEVDLAGPLVLDTDQCDTLPGDPMVVEQTGGGMVCVQRANRFQVTGDVRVVGSLPLIWLASDRVTIEGRLDASAHGTEPGPGGGIGATLSADAAGESPGLGGEHLGTFSDAGGGGGGACGAGGSGGRADLAAGGDGGAATSAGTDHLSPLRGGSGGGLGGSGESAGPGGAGGGALQITALNEIEVQGAVFVSGGGGQGGGDGTPGDFNVGSGGGGGSGGGLLLEATTITLGPVALLQAGGGGGGGGGSCRTAGPGQPGTDGREAADAAEGGSGGNPCMSGFTVGADGGESGSAVSLAGRPGGDRDTTDGDGANGGGGGGGAGCIVLRANNSPSSFEGRANPRIAPGFVLTEPR